MTVNDVRNELIKQYEAQNFVTDKTGVKTIEIIGASFHANEPTIFASPNESYIQKELDWYLSQSLNVYDIEGKTPKIWCDVADKDGNINSNYGYLIFSESNYEQYNAALTELVANPFSRRALMIYQRPTMHFDYCENGRSDFICTNAVQYLIRNDVLHVVVQMRSNDVVFGYRNDLAWQKFVAEKFLEDYRKATSSRIRDYQIHWNVGSLHLYERHFNYVTEEIFKRRHKAEAKELADRAFGNYVREVANHYEV